MNELTRVLGQLADRVADVMATDGGDLVHLEVGELADGSGRPYALVTTHTGGLEQVYRVAAPAPASAPAWASREWTVELRIDAPPGNVRWMRLEPEDPDDARTLCPVHEPGACPGPPECEAAHGWEDHVMSGPVFSEPRAFDIIERQEDESWQVVGSATGRTAWDALAAFKRDVGIPDAEIYEEPGGRPVVETDLSVLSCRPKMWTVEDLALSARQDTVWHFFALLRLFGVEGVSAGAVTESLDYQAVADRCTLLLQAASAAYTLAEKPEVAP